MEYTDTKTWLRTLAAQPGDTPTTAAARERLRSSFASFRQRATQLAEEIKRDLPEFTEHGTTHLDALWELTDLLAGESLPLSPAEAFVLGGAFLIHDAGMGVAAYPEGPASLRKDTAWNDVLAARLRGQLGRAPTQHELAHPDREAELDAIAELLRQRHAKHAEILATISWESHGTRYHLIDDIELRKAFGPTIGLIAQSHWWSVEEVRKKLGHLPRLGPPATIGCPAEWSIDRLKVACLLRTADAIHLDARRAPGYLRALRKPRGYADLHWSFQSHVHKPQVDGDRLVFTAGEPFKLSEAAAWWVGEELLANAHRELSQVDTLFQDLKREPRLRVRSVAGVESPERLMAFIPVEDWYPIDAHVRVSDVANLVRNLGGARLYGDDPIVPVRELIQNATDAVRARRLLQGKGTEWGDVVLRVGRDDIGDWLEVEDSGVGMSTAVLAGPLLDFGKSYWGTAAMRDEWPGLQGKGFESTGRFGIGFFSIFMLGDRVELTTRRFKDAASDTWVLTFEDGLDSRPSLRRAVETEIRDDGGTKVRVWTKRPFGPTFQVASRTHLSLEEMLAWLCPALDANLFVEHQAKHRTKVIAASDWLTMPPQDLCDRLWLEETKAADWDRYDYHREHYEVQREIANRYRLLQDPTGQPVGRASIPSTVFGGKESAGVLCVGGFRTGYTSHLAGVLAGTPTRAARDQAIPLVPSEELQRWAGEQASIVAEAYAGDPAALVGMAERVRGFGGDTGSLPIARAAVGWVSFQEVLRLARDGGWDRFYLVDSSFVNVRPYRVPALFDGVLAVPWRTPLTSSHDSFVHHKTADVPPGIPRALYFSLRFAVLEAVARGWNVSVKELLDSSRIHDGYRRFAMDGTDGTTDEKPPSIEAGTLDGEPWKRSADILTRPTPRMLDDAASYTENPSRRS